MPLHFLQPKHKERHENDGGGSCAGGGGGGGGDRANKVKQEVHLTRSQSDSCRRISKEMDRDHLRFVASVGEIQKFTVSVLHDSHFEFFNICMTFSHRATFIRFSLILLNYSAFVSFLK